MEDGSALCEAIASYESKTRLIIMSGYNVQTHQSGGWAIHLDNPSWKWVKDNTDYDLTLDTPQGNWTVKFDGDAKNHSIFAFVDKELVNALAYDKPGKGVRIHKGNKLLGLFALTDLLPVIRNVVRCVKEHPPTQNVSTPSANKAEEKGPSYGTGFFVADHYIITNHHIVKDCAAILVKYPSVRAEDAAVQASDPPNDLVLLKTDIANAGIPIGYCPSG